MKPRSSPRPQPDQRPGLTIPLSRLLLAILASLALWALIILGILALIPGGLP